MDEKHVKAAIAVGNKVRLRDGREGNVTEVKDNQIVVTTIEGETVHAQSSDAELVEGESAA